jgi:phage terminase small subunit
MLWTIDANTELLMPTLENTRHERFAQGIVKGLTVDAAYSAAGFKPHSGNASRLRGNERVRARIEELMTEAASAMVLSARWCVDELAKNHARAVAKGDLTSSNRALELIGRFFRAWTPEDTGDQQADHIPLAERLKTYTREREIAEANNVVPMTSRAS